jgi:hypothetical protein
MILKVNSDITYMTSIVCSYDTQHTTHLYELVGLNQPDYFVYVTANIEIIDSDLSHCAWCGGRQEKDGGERGQAC